MRSVFIVQHQSKSGDVKLIGVFSTRKNAESSVWRLKSEAGFSESSSGFSIDQYELDRVHWAEGYVEK